MRCALFLAVALSGCATAIHHDLQEVPVASTPAGARVYLDCGRGAMNVGTTPMTLVLRRRDACSITLSKTGWRDAVVRFHRAPSAAALTNAIPAALAAGIVSSSHVDIAANNGSTSGGIVTASASGSGSMSPAAVGAIVLSAALLVDIGSGALFEQSPRRVDVRLPPTR
ncbi:MAG: PEGA domain-containing protein [Acidobacteriota bacterium]|nr:PEGA domain-containing protein [Acidobacteriota bacterium]